MRRSALVLALCLCLASASLVTAAQADKRLVGAAGIGDPYFPMDGNGGYDVEHYDLDLRYDPASGRLSGTATIQATASQRLKRLNLDFDGLNVRSISVDDAAAKWHRTRGELVISPADALDAGAEFTAVIAYDGVPTALSAGGAFDGGWIATDDGALVLGQPHGASAWYPANDHPSDKASFTVAMEVPDGTEAVSNGSLVGSVSAGGWTTWTWDAPEPMATYLAMLAIGQFDIDAYDSDGIAFWDGLDPDLFALTATPSTGTRFAISQAADNSYKRLARTISVPAGGATLSFAITRDTEFPWDFAFVEAHTVGADDWTTLPDLNGHTSQDTGASCPNWLGIHPFLDHYQSDAGDGGCTPSGSTATPGSWWAATGASDGVETWSMDLSAFAGTDVEVSISYASDEIIQGSGVFVDDIIVSTGVGSTSFEVDGDTMDGWILLGAPTGSPGNVNDWIVGTVDDAPPSDGEVAQGSFARQPEILATLAESFGPYPFTASGGIVDDQEGLGFALETQTRPIYARDFFTDPFSGDSVVVHELAHQWYGDSLALERWQDIWLNEGFATYAEWLWSDNQGLGTAQEVFDFWDGVFAPEDGFWSLTIGDPGPDRLFDFAVYIRGAMTLHALRLQVGDTAFFDILETWATSRAGDNVTTDEFIALAESISGQSLGDLFDVWLFTASKPGATVLAPAARAAVGSARALREAPRVVRDQVARYGQDSSLGNVD